MERHLAGMAREYVVQLILDSDCTWVKFAPVQICYNADFVLGHS